VVVVSNTEVTPDEVACGAEPLGPVSTDVLHPRDVPLGGPRAIRVRRTLPQRDRSMVGAWCFADHYGPHDVTGGPGMDVPPHPHTGLQTVSWLFAGEIEHRDSGGVHATVRPGELNLMTAGAGICHSEVSTANTTTLHGVQLWVALPDADRDTARNFAHYVPPTHTIGDATVRVFLGELAGDRSPVATFTPLLGAQIDLPPRATVSIAVDRAFEHGVLLDQGDLQAGGDDLGIGDLWYQSPGRDHVELTNRGDTPARALLLGGAPFSEEIVMWWNFVGRTHDEIEAFRAQWQDQDERFGEVTGYPGTRLPAPTLPNGKLRPRRNPSQRGAP
jgi:redox-sensitive bicupin YhaK (pirin superfamily)